MKKPSDMILYIAFALIIGSIVIPNTTWIIDTILNVVAIVLCIISFIQSQKYALFLKEQNADKEIVQNTVEEKVQNTVEEKVENATEEKVENATEEKVENAAEEKVQNPENEIE